MGINIWKKTELRLYSELERLTNFPVNSKIQSREFWCFPLKWSQKEIRNCVRYDGGPKMLKIPVSAMVNLIQLII